MFLGLLIILRFWLWLCLSLSFCFRSAFSACCGSGYSLRSFLAFFRMLWLQLIFFGLSPHFSLAAATAVPSCLPQLFHLLQLRLLLPVFIPVFHMLLFRLLLSLLASLLLYSVLEILRLRFLGVRVLLFPAIMLLSIAGFSPNDFVYHWFVSSGCVFSLSVSSSSCLFVVFFAPASIPPQPVCLALFCVALWFSGTSDSFRSLVPVMTWSPFGTSQGYYDLCWLGFRGDCMWWYPFCFCLSSVPLPRSHLEFAHWVAPGFLWCSVWLGFWFFPAAIPIPTSLSNFRPSSGSSLVSFRSYSLRSLL